MKILLIILFCPISLLIASTCLGKIYSLMELRFNLPPIQKREFDEITVYFFIFCLMFKGLLWAFSPQIEKK